MESQDPFSVLDSGAIELHEIYMSYKKAGFSPDEALTLVGILLSND